MLKRGVLALSLSMLTLPSTDAAVGGVPRVLRVDDFEDGDRRAASGLSWISIADDLMGGASTATLQVAPAGAGAWVALDGRARATDISDFRGVRLHARGRGPLQFSVRGGPSPGFNYSARFEAEADWTPVDIPFESLKPLKPEDPALDLHSIGWLGVSVSGGRSGPFEFEVDDVELYAGRADARLRVLSGPTFAVDFTAAALSEVPPGSWTELAKDPQDDGKQKRLPDATAVSVSRDPVHDRVWFRITLSASMPERWMGANLALDVDGDPDNGMAWWGANQAFHFDRLVTVWGMESGSGYQGMLGIADAGEVQAGNLAGSGDDQVLVVLDRRAPAIVIGIPRRALGAGWRRYDWWPPWALPSSTTTTCPTREPRSCRADEAWAGGASAGHPRPEAEAGTHSDRSATSGSTFAARRAGMRQAMRATRPRIRATLTNVMPSTVLIP
jgi:hypothetical protein